MKKIDILLGAVTGAITAFFFYSLLSNIATISALFDKIGLGQRGLLWVMLIVFTLLTPVGLWLSYLIGKRFLFIFQAAKFFLTGVLATVADLAILDFLIWVSGIAIGWPFSVFKGISFICATTGKYVGNKLWTFEKIEGKGMGKEVSQFIIVTFIGFVINVGVASFVVNGIKTPAGVTPALWANIGGIIAAFSSAAWNFFGYKFIVFKK